MKKILLHLLIIIHCIMICANQKITLVFQTKNFDLFETDWILELLENFDLEIINDGNYQNYINNSIIVVQNYHIPYYLKLKDMGYNFGIIVLSDEGYAAPINFDYPKFILRNYWNKKYLNRNVLAIPLGYKSGFWKDARQYIPKSYERKYHWSFAGQINNKPTRQNMLDSLKTITNYHTHITNDFEDPNALSVNKYRDLLLNSIFLPCPTGWGNLDSFRLYEALECGCIPIVETKPIDYFKKFLGQHPFISIENWQEAPEIIKELIKDPIMLEKRRLECYAWWQNYKKELKQNIKNIIEKSFN